MKRPALLTRLPAPGSRKPQAPSCSSPSFKPKPGAGRQKPGAGSEPRNLNLLAAFERRFMRADADHRPVDRCLDVRHGRLLAQACHQEIVRQMWMRATMPAPLQE